MRQEKSLPNLIWGVAGNHRLAAKSRGRPSGRGSHTQGRSTMMVVARSCGRRIHPGPGTRNVDLSFIVSGSCGVCRRSRWKTRLSIAHGVSTQEREEEERSRKV